MVLSSSFVNIGRTCIRRYASKSPCARFSNTAQQLTSLSFGAEHTRRQYGSQSVQRGLALCPALLSPVTSLGDAKKPVYTYHTCACAISSSFDALAHLGLGISKPTDSSSKLNGPCSQNALHLSERESGVVAASALHRMLKRAKRRHSPKPRHLSPHEAIIDARMPDASTPRA